MSTSDPGSPGETIDKLMADLTTTTEEAKELKEELTQDETPTPVTESSVIARIATIVEDIQSHNIKGGTLAIGKLRGAIIRIQDAVKTSKSQAK